MCRSIPGIVPYIMVEAVSIGPHPVARQNKIILSLLKPSESDSPKTNGFIFASMSSYVAKATAMSSSSPNSSSSSSLSSQGGSGGHASQKVRKKNSKNSSSGSGHGKSRRSSSSGNKSSSSTNNSNKTNKSSSRRSSLRHLYDRNDSQSRNMGATAGADVAVSTKFFVPEVSRDGFGEDTKPLSWRDDADESLSDWTIVATTPLGDVRTYSVHKAVIGAGERKCLYFGALFHTDCREHSMETSNISLQGPEELDALEIMLDFLYSGILTIPGDDGPNVVILRHLAFYFQCKSFMTEINKFIEQDLTADRAPWYLMEATKYRDERLVASGLTICAHCLTEIAPAKLRSIPVELFRFVLLSPQLNCDSRQLSRIVCDYLEKEVEQDDEKIANGRVPPAACVVLEFTQVNIMPEMDADAARRFLNMMRFMDATIDSEWEALQSLCQRCMDAIAEEKWMRDQNNKTKKKKQQQIKTSKNDKSHQDDDDQEEASDDDDDHHQESWSRRADWMDHRVYHRESGFVVEEMAASLRCAQRLHATQAQEIRRLKEEIARLEIGIRASSHQRTSSSPQRPRRRRQQQQQQQAVVETQQPLPRQHHRHQHQDVHGERSLRTYPVDMAPSTTTQPIPPPEAYLTTQVLDALNVRDFELIRRYDLEHAQHPAVPPPAAILESARQRQLQEQQLGAAARRRAAPPHVVVGTGGGVVNYVTDQQFDGLSVSWHDPRLIEQQQQQQQQQQQVYAAAATTTRLS